MGKYRSFDRASYEKRRGKGRIFFYGWLEDKLSKAIARERRRRNGVFELENCLCD